MRKGGKLEGWKVEKLGDLCEKITDGTHVTPTYVSEGVPFLSVKNLTKGFIDFSDTRFISREEHEILTKRVRPEKEDILYTKVGTTGIAKVVDVDDEFSIFVSIALLKIKHELIFNRYLEHFLNSPIARAQAQKRTRGMANKNLVITDIKEIEIHYPTSLPEQQRIVSVLDEAFASIAQAKSNAERNLVNARELFETALAKMYENAGEYWEEKNLGDIASEMQTGPFGSTLHKSDYVANGIPVINPQNLVDGKIIPLQKMMVNQKTKERLSRYILQEKDIVLARRGEMGRCAIVEKEQAGWLCGSGSFIVRVKKEVDANYLVRYLSSAKVKRILQKGSVGTTMDNLNQGILSQVPVPFPPLAEQRAIVGRLEALSAETGRLEEIYQQKVESLEELKKSVLGKAFEGEL